MSLINDLSFEIPEGKRTSFLAPFGSGKTTLLKIIAGLELASGGAINPPSGEISVYIPSAPVSLPWFNVTENFSLVSEDQGLKNEIIKLLELEGYEKHYPDNRSHGFRFLVALGMALLSGKKMILLDDSLNGLSDPMKLRIAMILDKIVELKKITVVYATSSLSDAVLFSDRVIAMKGNPLSVLKVIELPGIEKESETVSGSKSIDEAKKQIVDLYSSFDIGKVINLSF